MSDSYGPRLKIWKSDDDVYVLADISSIQKFGKLKLTVYLKSGQSIEMNWADGETRNSKAKSLADALEMYYLGA